MKTRVLSLLALASAFAAPTLAPLPAHFAEAQPTVTGRRRNKKLRAKNRLAAASRRANRNK